MKILTYYFLFFFCVVQLSDLQCQTRQKKPEESPVGFRGFYVTIMHTRISAFPLYRKTDSNGIPTETSIGYSSSGPAFAVGVSVMSHNKLYFGLEFEYSKFSFSNDRVPKRNVSFYYVLLNGGILLSQRPPSVLYLSFGGGAYSQADYPDIMEEDYWLEYLGDKGNHIVFGFGFQISPIKNVILKGELKYAFTKSELIPTDDRDWYYEWEAEPQYENGGTRLSLGVSYIFWVVKN